MVFCLYCLAFTLCDVLCAAVRFEKMGSAGWPCFLGPPHLDELDLGFFNGRCLLSLSDGNGAIFRTIGSCLSKNSGKRSWSRLGDTSTMPFQFVGSPGSTGPRSSSNARFQAVAFRLSWSIVVGRLVPCRSSMLIVPQSLQLCWFSQVVFSSLAPSFVSTRRTLRPSQLRSMAFRLLQCRRALRSAFDGVCAAALRLFAPRWPAFCVSVRFILRTLYGAPAVLADTARWFTVTVVNQTAFQVFVWTSPHRGNVRR